MHSESQDNVRNLRSFFQDGESGAIFQQTLADFFLQLYMFITRIKKSFNTLIKNLLIYSAILTKTLNSRIMIL